MSWDYAFGFLTYDYSQCKSKHYKDEFSTLSFSRKELQDDHYRSTFAGSLSPASTSKMALDPLLSFLHGLPAADKSDDVQADFSAGVSLEEKGSQQTLLERYTKQLLPCLVLLLLICMFFMHRILYVCTLIWSLLLLLQKWWPVSFIRQGPWRESTEKQVCTRTTIVNHPRWWLINGRNSISKSCLLHIFRREESVPLLCVWIY